MRCRQYEPVILVACACLAGASGCKKGQSESPGERKDTGITRTALRGPVKLTVQTDRSRATIAERFVVTVSVEADDGVDVTMPEFGESLGAFAIRDFSDTSARPIEGGKRRWQQRYEVDCELSGTYTVEPIAVTFVDRRAASVKRAASTSQPTSQAGVQGSLTAESFELEVTSLLEGEFDPTAFRDVKGPAEIPVPPSRWYWWVVGIGLGTIVVAVAIVLLVRRRRGRGPDILRIPPHQWGMEQLQALVDEDLIGQGQIQAFYYRLNGIVRQYIELRFELMAPEMTTEEFLDALRNSDLLAPGHKELLERFMTACDMVKYARYQPGTEEIEAVFAAARDFIEQTTENGRRGTSARSGQAMQESAA